MKRYIDADALIKDIENDCPEVVYYTKRDALDCIQSQPIADVVEVVRCKDCKHCFHVSRPNYERYECEYYGTSDEVVDYVQPTHFCSYGERRGKDE